MDNLGAYQRWFGFQPNTKVATLIFGLIHGFGLAVKIQEYEVPDDGLLANLIAFNVGVELGQFMALAMILLLMTIWRKTLISSKQLIKVTSFNVPRLFTCRLSAYWLCHSIRIFKYVQHSNSTRC